MTTFPEDAVKRIGDARRQAESDLKASLVLIEGDDITPYLFAFTSFAIALYDAEAEEFVGVCNESDSLEGILRNEVSSRIIESILPDKSLEIVRERRSGDAGRHPIIREVGSQVIHEEQSSGELRRAGEYIQGIHAQHGYWERFMPPHIGFFVRPRDNVRVREELSQVLQRRVFYWIGEFSLRRRVRRNAKDASQEAGQTASQSGRSIVRPENWEDIELSFISDHHLEIRVGGEVQKFHYKEIEGFEDRRTGKPSQLWTMVRVFHCQANGITLLNWS